MSFSVDFVPSTETQDLSYHDKINYILTRVIQRSIVVLETSLTPEEEMGLIEKTMKHINFKDFNGIRLVSFDSGETLKRTKLFGRSSNTRTFTIVAPNDAVSILKDARGILSIKFNR